MMKCEIGWFAIRLRGKWMISVILTGFNEQEKILTMTPIRSSGGMTYG